jgi:hypothetical protein
MSSGCESWTRRDSTDIARLFRQAFTLLVIHPKIVLGGSSGAIVFTV